MTEPPRLSYESHSEFRADPFQESSFQETQSVSCSRRAVYRVLRQPDGTVKPMTLRGTACQPPTVQTRRVHHKLDKTLVCGHFP